MDSDDQICRMPVSEAMRRALLLVAVEAGGRREFTRQQLAQMQGDEDGFVGLVDNGNLVVRANMGS